MMGADVVTALEAGSTMQETPYWWSGLEEPVLAGTGALPDGADVAILGGGYTGLAAARRLARAGARTLVLEKQAIGEGASSRNGGQVLTGLKVGVRELLRRFGRERARSLFSASLDAIALLERLVAEEAVDCGYERCGHLEAAAKPGHFAELERDQEVLARDFDHHVRLLPPGEQRTELGTGFYHGVLLDEHSASLHPGRYVRGLAAAAVRAGAELRERTPALEIRREGAGFRVVTTAGSVKVRDVVVATNGYTDSAVPALRRRVVPVGSYIIATAPLGAQRAAAVLPRRRVVFDTRNFLFYFRLSADNRLIFGGRAQWTPATARSIRTSADVLRVGLGKVFPELRDVAIDYAWGGNVCFTTDLLPRAGRLDGLHYALGYGGHGVAMATFLGDVIADVVLGGPDRNPFRDLPFPPIPLYDGRPWFLPFVGAAYRLLDWIR
jgi:glycine/D-amino acid oxidase-like deaminating enzyme